MNYETILYDLTDGIAEIRLNRPQRLNAVTQQLYDELNDALTRAEADGDANAGLTATVFVFEGLPVLGGGEKNVLGGDEGDVAFGLKFGADGGEVGVLGDEGDVAGLKLSAAFGVALGVLLTLALGTADADGDAKGGAVAFGAFG